MKSQDKGDKMKIVLAAINAKYIHSNLAVYNLKAYASAYTQQIEIAEYTINQYTEQILRDLYKRQPDILAFSCYIWNIAYVKELIANIKKVLPSVSIWLGGPEVSYDAKRVMEQHPEVDIVCCGEGEETFLELVTYFDNQNAIKGMRGHGDEHKKSEHVNHPSTLKDVKGIVYKDKGSVVQNPMREPMDLSAIPFIYEDLKPFRNKIIYYESSRGCPFSCSYCLSSIDKKLRFRKLELVKRELQYFLDAKVSQVKFIDRTFNCKRAHAYEIWSYLQEHDNGITNFHFEVAADLLEEEEVALFQTMRPGLIQLEIGVQSTKEETIAEIRRTMQFSKVAHIVAKIKETRKVHQHLDLIAGLPFEGYERFMQSFNQVYALRPEQLQLGFLKVLKGSYMEEQRATYDLVYTSKPPYEVLSTKWLSYEEVLRLKGIEEMVEIYYNSGQFEHTIPYLEKQFDTPFALYESLSEFYEEKGLHLLQHNRVARYEILFEFAVANDEKQKKQYQELLTYDLYLRENLKNRPAFLGQDKNEEQEIVAFYNREEKEFRYLKGYAGRGKRQLRKMTHIETFSFEVTKDMAPAKCRLLFDYQNRNPLTHQATVIDLAKEEQKV
jgi:Fe-S oxidoreductase